MIVKYWFNKIKKISQSRERLYFIKSENHYDFMNSDAEDLDRLARYLNPNMKNTLTYKRHAELSTLNTENEKDWKDLLIFDED